MNKIICELKLTDYGLIPYSSSLEIKKLSHGFSVLMTCEELMSRATRIARTKKEYSWRNCAELLLNAAQQFADENAWKQIQVEGEKGLRASILSLASCQEKYLLPYLLQQSEESIDFLEKQFNDLKSKDDYDVLCEFSENAHNQNGECDIITLFEFYGLKPEKNAFEKLIELLEEEYEAIAKLNEAGKILRLLPFKVRIENFVQQFDDTKRRIGAGMSGGKPSQRQIVEKYLKQYVLENGTFPKGKREVRIPFLGGEISAGSIDFKNITSAV